VPLVEVGEHYARIRTRLTGLMEDLDADDWDTPVQACPGWTVRDVLSHLAGTVEDALAGRLTGPPSDEQTAEQVARLRARPADDLLAEWTASSPAFEEVISGFRIWPAAYDVLSHEHDVRHAVDRPGARDDPLVPVAASMLLHRFDGKVRLDAVLDGEEVLVDGPQPPLGLRASAFEVFRASLGRRSVDQVRRLDWTGDPSGLVASFSVFDCPPQALVE
jgi:uncharacterized protein (TIGR03083 family)